MSPVAFSVAGFEIRWYSLLILIAVFLAYFLTKNEASRFQIPKEFVFNLIFWVLIFGIIGARLYYVIFNLDYYKTNVSEIYKVWHGGLAIHGGIIAGLITIFVYTRKYKMDTRKMIDIMVPGVLIAQAIGRWGNFFNHEAYGSVIEYSKLIKMKFIPQFVIDEMYINGNYHLPMFYFESIACIIGFIILVIIRRKKYIKDGEITGFYLIWYGVVRFIIEIFRSDSLMLGNIKVAQVVCALMVFAGVFIVWTQSKKLKLEDLYNTSDDVVRY